MTTVKTDDRLLGEFLQGFDELREDRMFDLILRPYYPLIWEEAANVPGY